jgi:predicted permease
MLRPLVRAFLARFFENDLTSGAGDARLATFAIIATLAMPGLVVPILFAGASGSADPSTWGWAMVAKHSGPDALRVMSLSGKTLYLGLAFAVAGLLGAITWSSVLPDRRDALVLGPLPVSATTILGAKLTALGLALAIVAAAIHTVASVTFGILLAAENSFGFALRGIAAHFVASVGLSVFVGLTIVGLQGAVLLVVGPKRFAAVSPVLQWLVITATVAALLALSTIADASATTVGAKGAATIGWPLAVPTMWFLGLYERVLGTSNPILLMLSTRALVALAVSIGVVGITYPLAYRRLMSQAYERPADRRRRQHASAAIGSLVSRIAGSARSPRRAVSAFYLSALARGPQQRLVVAGALGAGVACGVPSLFALTSGITTEPNLPLVVWASAASLCLLVGLRIAAALPIDQSGAWLFDVVRPSRRDVRVAVERTMFAVGVVPLALISAAFYGYWWGLDSALAHLLVAPALGALIIALLLWRSTDIPSTRAWSLDGDHLRQWWPVYLLVFLAAATALPALEYVSIGHPIVAAGIATFFYATARAIRSHALTKPDTSADVETSGSVIATALRVGHARAIDDGEDEGPVVRRVGAGRIGTPIFEVFRSAPGEERWFDDLSVRPREIWRDVTFAVRRLIGAPAFTLFSVLTLALGIGAPTSMYLLMRSVVSAEMTIRDPSRVVVVRTSESPSLSWLDYQDLRRAQTSFSGVEAMSHFPASLAWNGTASLAEGNLVTGGFFQLLGVTALRGRLLEPSDDRPEAPPVVAIGEALWRTKFGADPAIVGATISVGDSPYTVVGIVPKSFQGVRSRGRPVGVFAPGTHPPLTERDLTAYRDPMKRTATYLTVIGRLSPESNLLRAKAEIYAIGKTLDEDAPLPRGFDAGGRSWDRVRSFALVPIAHDEWAERMWRGGRIYLMLPALVLLIACTTLANLALSRGASRRAEFAVRRARGASRWALIREHVIELGMIAAAGAGAALVLTRASIAMVARFVETTLGTQPQFEVDATIGALGVAIVIALAIFCTFVAGFVPALVLSGGSLATAVGGGATGTSSPRWRGRARLISVQVAASVALLLVAALAVRSAWDVRASSDLEALTQLAVAQVPFGLQQRDEARVGEMTNAILADLRRVPGVQTAAVTSGFAGADALSAQASTPERPFVAAEDGVSLVSGTPSMFRALGIALLSGRLLDERDVAGGPPVVVVSEGLARRLFGTTGAAGRPILVRTRDLLSRSTVQTVTVVGTVPDTRSPRTGDPQAVVYAPLTQRMAPDLTVMVRTAPGDADAMVTAIRTAIRRVDPNLAVSFAGRGDVLAGASVLTVTLVAQVVAVLALAALLLAMTGLYGVLSHIVSRREREMGIRLALGADRTTLVSMVMIDGARPVVVGVGAGVVLAALGRLSLQPILERAVNALDPVAIAIAAVPLVVAAAVACYLPARRAAAVDPNQALRS